MGDEVERRSISIEQFERQNPNYNRPLDHGELRDRVAAYNRLELPGQPKEMHVGTFYLIADLWRMVRELRERSMSGAERYWEGRWRDADAENDKLRARIAQLERDR